MSCRLLDGDAPAEENHVYEFDQKIVKKWFKNGRYGRIGTIGDGSCFFHSVCRAIDLNGYCDGSNAERKKIVAAFRCELSESFTEEDYHEILQTIVGANHKSFATIKEQLCQPHTWAEEIMIKWCSRKMNLNIIFLNLGKNKNTMYCGVHDPSTVKNISKCKVPSVDTVVVAWVDNSHFELVVRIDDIDSKMVSIRKLFDPKNAKDLETIENVMIAYTTQCNLKK
jgi:hypothetical protein